MTNDKYQMTKQPHDPKFKPQTSNFKINPEFQLPNCNSGFERSVVVFSFLNFRHVRDFAA
jgi:hypothetical protein